MVRSARPHVWIEGDTLFAATEDGGGDVTIRANSYDTNGTLSKYYWDFNSVNGLDTNVTGSYKTNWDSIIYPINPTSVNVPFNMASFGKDDDGLVSGDTFWLYPDGPPPAPDTVSPPLDHYVNTAHIKLVWEGVDFLDGTNTQFKVLMDVNPDPVAVISDFKAGIQYAGEGANRFSFTATLQGLSQGTKFWRVVARDRSGSEKEGAISRFYYGP
jgi:hypothetical protein